MILRRPDGERPEDHAVDQSEDSGIGADAERQRENREGREDAVRGHRPDRVAQSLAQLLGGGPGPKAADLFVKPIV